MSGTVWEWSAFAAVVAVFIAADLFVHRRGAAARPKQAVAWSVFAVAVGLAFGGYVLANRGARAAAEYLAAYLLEESLSLDNLFVFLIIFRMLQVPEPHQRVALSWGVFGALVFRAVFVFLGVEVLHHWAWVEYVFAALLLYGAFRAVREDPADAGNDNRLVAWLSEHLPVSAPQDRPKFLVREAGVLKATPLLVAIIGLEATDILFAVDSVPAAFSVTRDEFLIYSSNVFAILGLRSLYMVIAHAIAGLRYLHFGLAAVLAFAGAKMLLAKAGIEIPPLLSVALIIVAIGAAAGASLWAGKRRPKQPPGQAPASNAGLASQQTRPC
jgi:tellurite resistance protein TerC